MRKEPRTEAGVGKLALQKARAKKKERKGARMQLARARARQGKRKGKKARARAMQGKGKGNGMSAELRKGGRVDNLEQAQLMTAMIESEMDDCLPVD